MIIVSQETVIAGQSWNLIGTEPILMNENWLWNPALWSQVVKYGADKPVNDDDLNCDWVESFAACALEFINDRLPEGFIIHADGTMTFSHYTFQEISQERAESIADNAQWEAEYLDELFDVLADLIRGIKEVENHNN